MKYIIFLTLFISQSSFAQIKFFIVSDFSALNSDVYQGDTVTAGLSYHEDLPDTYYSDTDTLRFFIDHVIGLSESGFQEIYKISFKDFKNLPINGNGSVYMKF